MNCGKTKDVGDGQYYWLAINGSTATLSPIPVAVEKLDISPTPKNLIGFRSRDEALAAQQQ